MIESIQVRGYRSLREFHGDFRRKRHRKIESLPLPFVAPAGRRGPPRRVHRPRGWHAQPAVGVFNEAESSLHPGLLQSLAQMVAKAPTETQIIVVTHSEPLATSIIELCAGKSIRLITHEGETRLEGQGDGKRVWIFED